VKQPPPPFILIPDTISHELGEAIEQLYDGWRRGELIGLAFTGMIRRRGYIVNAAGECYRSPTFTRGMVAALDDQLALRVRGGND